MSLPEQNLQISLEGEEPQEELPSYIIVALGIAVFLSACLCLGVGYFAVRMVLGWLA
jgi:hypothetical protein